MMQLNSKELKNFRDTLALWHIADFKKADADVSRNKYIKNYTNAIATNNERLEKIANGETTLGNADEIEAENVAFAEKIEKERVRVAELKAEYDKDCAKGLALITDSLKTALQNYVSDIYNADNEQALLNALVVWFKDNGAKDADIESVRPYVRVLGVKKNSSNAKCKDNVHNGAYKGKTLEEIFLGGICDEPTMKKVLPTHKWENVIEKKVTEKAEKNTK